MTNRTTSISRILFILYIAVVCYLCFNSFDGMSLKRANFLGFQIDKVIHFAMFLPFMELLYLAIGKRFRTPAGCLGVILLLFTIGCCLAAMTELYQSWFTTTRVADLGDFRADAIALIVGSAGVFFTEILRRR